MMPPAKIPYDVNDSVLRVEFLTKILPELIDSLEETVEPEWGIMSAQHMVEHLLFAFRMSTGRLEVECETPKEKLEQTQAFLNLNRAMPRGFTNPVTGEELLDLQYESMTQAKKELKKEIRHYFAYYDDNPKAKHTNPVFGNLGFADWQKFHFKHCFHHLSQFRLIEEKQDA